MNQTHRRTQPENMERASRVTFLRILLIGTLVFYALAASLAWYFFSPAAIKSLVENKQYDLASIRVGTVISAGKQVGIPLKYLLPWLLLRREIYESEHENKPPQFIPIEIDNLADLAADELFIAMYGSDLPVHQVDSFIREYLQKQHSKGRINRCAEVISKFPQFIDLSKDFRIHTLPKTKSSPFRILRCDQLNLNWHFFDLKTAEDLIPQYEEQKPTSSDKYLQRGPFLVAILDNYSHCVKNLIKSRWQYRNIRTGIIGQVIVSPGGYPAEVWLVGASKNRDWNIAAIRAMCSINYPLYWSSGNKELIINFDDL